MNSNVLLSQLSEHNEEQHTCIAEIDTPIKERGYDTILYPSASSSRGVNIGVLPPPSSMFA